MKDNIKKYETVICIFSIIIYVVLNSFCMQKYGIASIITLSINLFLSIGILVYILKNKLAKYYGFVRPKEVKKFMYFIPLIAIVFTNLLNGINIQNPTNEIVYYILNMILVGFIEEVIFRGFLFRMMEKDNLKRAMIISSLTFGIGHIVNLLNGADIIPTLIQICYSFSIGYLFVIILYKSSSIWPCIVTHGLLNGLCIFNIENIISMYVIPIILISISILYIIYINYKDKK